MLKIIRKHKIITILIVFLFIFAFSSISSFNNITTEYEQCLNHTFGSLLKDANGMDFNDWWLSINDFSLAHRVTESLKDGLFSGLFYAFIISYFWKITELMRSEIKWKKIIGIIMLVFIAACGACFIWLIHLQF